MGYVNITDISQFIPPAEIQKSAGTWTPTLSGHLVCDVRTAAAAGFYLFIPIRLPASNAATQAAKIKSVDIWYKVATAAMAGMASVVAKKMTLSANGVAVAGEAFADVTLDANHDTMGERLAAADHKMTVSFDDEPFLEDDEVYYIIVSCEGAATSVFTLFGAQANFELRL